MKGFIRHWAAKLKLSAPNLKILSTLVQRIHNICDETQQIMMAIKATFGLTEMDENFEEKRQVILTATAVVSSLVTYFGFRWRRWRIDWYHQPSDDGNPKSRDTNH